MKPIDFGQVAKSYARSREDIPVNLMDSLLIRGISFQGKMVADIGSGTGSLTRKMALRKANVLGIEPSLELREQADAWNRAKNYSIPYLQGTAENTGLQDSHFDIVTVMRAWHWFDRQRALKEIKRILKAKGIFLVIDSGFLPGSSAVEKTFEVLTKYVEGGLKPAGSIQMSKQQINSFPVEWFEEWKQSGFEVRDFYKLNYSVPFTKEEWVDRAASLSWLAGLDEKIREEALEELANSLPNEEPYIIPHDCNVCVLRMLND